MYTTSPECSTEVRATSKPALRNINSRAFAAPDGERSSVTVFVTVDPSSSSARHRFLFGHWVLTFSGLTKVSVGETSVGVGDPTGTSGHRVQSTLADGLGEQDEEEFFSKVARIHDRLDQIEAALGVDRRQVPSSSKRTERPRPIGGSAYVPMGVDVSASGRGPELSGDLESATRCSAQASSERAAPRVAQR